MSLGPSLLLLKRLATKKSCFSVSCGQGRRHKIVCVSACLHVCVPACLRVSLSGCFPVCASLRVCVFASLRVCLSACLRVCVCACLVACAHVSLRLCLSACLRVCASTSLRVFVSACLRVYVSTCLQVEIDCGYNHEERKGRLPVLDVEVWVGETEDGKLKILHSHYMKDVSSRLVMGSRSAHGENTKRNVMVNEICRILKNCSIYLPWEEAADKVSYFVKRRVFWV